MLARNLGRGAILFDLDDTLIDSLGDIAHAANALLSELGRPLLAPEAYLPMVGDGAEKLVERAMAASGEVISGARLRDLTAR